MGLLIPDVSVASLGGKMMDLNAEELRIMSMIAVKWSSRSFLEEPPALCESNAHAESDEEIVALEDRADS